MSGAAGAAAAAAAAARLASMREEEERLTKYAEQDLNEGWEFKIVRSTRAIKGERFYILCQEEARNGWELVEKFDDSRVRFKRSTEWRNSPPDLQIDPYRTTYGMSETKVVLLVLGIIMVLTIAFVMFIATR